MKLKDKKEVENLLLGIIDSANCAKNDLVNSDNVPGCAEWVDAIQDDASRAMAILDEAQIAAEKKKDTLKRRTQ